MNALLAENTPQTDTNASKAGEEGQIIGGLVASQSVGALAVTVSADNRVSVVDSAIQKVENISAENWGQGHDTPVLGKTANAEGVGGQRGEDAEQKAVGNAGEAGHDDERVGVGDGRAAKLGKGEDHSGDKETPETGHVQLLDEEIRANTCTGERWSAGVELTR